MKLKQIMINDFMTKLKSSYIVEEEPRYNMYVYKEYLITKGDKHKQVLFTKRLLDVITVNGLKSLLQDLKCELRDLDE